MFGFVTLTDHYGNVILEADASAVTSDDLALASHVITEDGEVLDAERVLLDA